MCQALELARTPACSRPMTPRGFCAPFQGAGIIWDLYPGWASFLGQPGAIGCNAFGVGSQWGQICPFDRSTWQGQWGQIRTLRIDGAGAWHPIAMTGGSRCP